MLITGIAAALVNWNPLIKLDGYYMLSETLGLVDLKETSTAYVSAWVKHYIWRLPVEVPYIPKRRRLGYVIYALLSGLYSYTVLYVVARFVGNVFRNFNPDWSFIPELLTAGVIFRSRIRLLVNFMKFVYLDKKDRVRVWFTPRHLLELGVVVTVLLLLPLRRDAVAGRFVLEPSERAVLRAEVPGVVTAVYSDEGEPVKAGATVLSLRNLPLQSSLAHSSAESTIASGRATSASLQYANFGPMVRDRDRLVRQTRELSAEAANLELQSPIDGIILTPRLKDRVGTYITEGTEMAEVGNLRHLRARIYVPEHDVYKLHLGSEAHLQVEGIPKIWDARALAISPLSTEMDPGLAEQVQYKGLLPPNFYLVDLVADNPEGELKPGMTGTARIYGQRRSIAEFAWEEITNFFGRKIW
jgi:putative peptide zinc metalloprotease protein